MDDGLDAFLEAAGGAVRVEVPHRPASDLEALQGKACHLLGVWSAPTPEYVVVGDQSGAVGAARLGRRPRDRGARLGRRPRDRRAPGTCPTTSRGR